MNGFLSSYSWEEIRLVPHFISLILLTKGARCWCQVSLYDVEPPIFNCRLGLCEFLLIFYTFAATIDWWDKFVFSISVISFCECLSTSEIVWMRSSKFHLNWALRSDLTTFIMDWISWIDRVNQFILFPFWNAYIHYFYLKFNFKL